MSTFKKDITTHSTNLAMGAVISIFEPATGLGIGASAVSGFAQLGLSLKNKKQYKVCIRAIEDILKGELSAGASEDDLRDAVLILSAENAVGEMSSSQLAELAKTGAIEEQYAFYVFQKLNTQDKTPRSRRIAISAIQAGISICLKDPEFKQEIANIATLSQSKAIADVGHDVENLQTSVDDYAENSARDKKTDQETINSLNKFVSLLENNVQSLEAEKIRLEKEKETDQNEIRKLNDKITALRGQIANPVAAKDQSDALRERINSELHRASNQLDEQNLKDAKDALDQGDFSKADQLFQRIADSHEFAIQSAARAFYIRGEIAEQQVDWTEAAKLYRRAAELDDQFWNLKKAHEFTHWAGQYKAAHPLALKAKNKAFQEYGKDSAEYALALNDLALTLEYLSDLKEAKKLFLQALKLRQRILPNEHKDVSTSLSNLANLYRAQGKYDQAEPLLVQAIEIDKKTIGEEHPNYATHLNNLAELYRAQGKYDQAEPLYLQAVEIGKKTIGEAHPNYAIRLNNLAGLYHAQRKYDQAEPLFMQAIDSATAALGADHPDTKLYNENYQIFLQSKP